MNRFILAFKITAKDSCVNFNRYNYNLGKKVSKDFLSSYLVEIQNSYLLMNQLSWLKNRDKLSQVEKINVFIKENSKILYLNPTKHTIIDTIIHKSYIH